MKLSHFLIFLLSLSALSGCFRCVDCENLYHEPTIKVVFQRLPLYPTTIKTVNIKSFNDDSIMGNVPQELTLLNTGKATYYFPLTMNKDSSVFNIKYEVVKPKFATIVDSAGKTIKIRSTVSGDSVTDIIQVKNYKFTLAHTNSDYKYDDRLLRRAYISSIDTTGNIKGDSISYIINCFNYEATVYLFVDKKDEK